MNNIFIFILPPIVGACIGYFTNVAAIKMLFRPLKEIRLFGIRLPFTPGILPKQRHKLAQSIGSMVERELLTPDILRTRLKQDEVRKKIKDTLNDKIPGAIDRLYPVITSEILAYLRKEDVRLQLESKGRIFLRNVLLKMNVLQRFFVAAAKYDITLEEKMPQIIDSLLISFENYLENEEDVKKTLVKTLTGETLFNKMMSTLDSQIEAILSSINVKTLVLNRIDSLDMLRVERIILDVMADQLKWINVFGGILGFLIGSFQVALTWFLR